MARRSGRPGDYLLTDDYSGATIYASEARRDFWGNYGKKVLERNLQEISMPLNDPAPVPVLRGPQYESTVPCQAEIAPIYVGLTTVPTNQNNMGFQALDLDPAIPNMVIGCTFIVRPDPGTGGYSWDTGNWDEGGTWD